MVAPSAPVAQQSTALQKRFRKSWGDWFDAPAQLPAVPTHTPVVLPPAAPLSLEDPGLALEVKGNSTTTAATVLPIDLV